MFVCVSVFVFVCLCLSCFMPWLLVMMSGRGRGQSIVFGGDCGFKGIEVGVCESVLGTLNFILGRVRTSLLCTSLCVPQLV